MDIFLDIHLRLLVIQYMKQTGPKWSEAVNANMQHLTKGNFQNATLNIPDEPDAQQNREQLFSDI